MRPDPIKEPRRVGEHVAFALDFLKEHGAENVRVYKTRHLQVVFNLGRHELTIHMACTPLNAHDAIAHFRQELTRVVKKTLETLH